MGIPATALQPWRGSPHALHVAAAHVVSLIAPRFRSSLNVMRICKFYANSANMRIGFAYQQIPITSAYLHHMRAERSGERFLIHLSNFSPLSPLVDPSGLAETEQRGLRPGHHPMQRKSRFSSGFHDPWPSQRLAGAHGESRDYRSGSIHTHTKNQYSRHPPHLSSL